MRIPRAGGRSSWTPVLRPGWPVLATLPTAVRRRAPVPVLLSCYLFWIWQVLLGYNPVVTTYGILLAMYTVAATQPGRRTAQYLGFGSLAWIVIGVAEQTGSVAGVMLQGLVVPAVIWKAGDSAQQLDRSNRLLLEADEERGEC